MREKQEVVAKAVRIGEDLKSFINEHPEVTLVTEHGKVQDIILPVEASNVTRIIVSDKVYYLEYTYHDELITYSSPLARKSILYRLLN